MPSLLALLLNDQQQCDTEQGKKGLLNGTSIDLFYTETILRP